MIRFSFQLHRDHNFIAAMKLSIPSSFSNSKFSNIQRLLLVSEGPHALPGGKSSWEPCTKEWHTASHMYRENMATSPRLIYIYIYIYVNIPGTQFWPVFWLFKAFFWRVEAPKHIIIEDKQVAGMYVYIYIIHDYVYVYIYIHNCLYLSISRDISGELSVSFWIKNGWGWRWLYSWLVNQPPPPPPLTYPHQT